MTLRLIISSTLVLLIALLSTSCTGLSSHGDLSVYLNWETTDPKLSEAEDGDIIEGTGEFGDCEASEVRIFDYSLEDTSDCELDDGEWYCDVVASDTRETCKENIELIFEDIRGGDYVLHIWGYDGEGDPLWNVACEDLHVDGDAEYDCDIAYSPEEDSSGRDAGSELSIALNWETIYPKLSEAEEGDAVEGTSEFAACEMAEVQSFDYLLEDMNSCEGDGPDAVCDVVAEETNVLCEENIALSFGKLSDGDYMLSIWGYDGEGNPTWSAACEDLAVDGEDIEYECNILYFPEGE